MENVQLVLQISSNNCKFRIETTLIESKSKLKSKFRLIYEITEHFYFLFLCAKSKSIIYCIIESYMKEMNDVIGWYGKAYISMNVESNISNMLCMRLFQYINRYIQI